VGFCLTGVKGRVEVCRVRRTPKENGCGFTALFCLEGKMFYFSLCTSYWGGGCTCPSPDLPQYFFESNFYLQILKVYNACQGLPMKKYIEVNEQVIKNMGTYWNIRRC